jgi:hypothetical protein
MKCLLSTIFLVFTALLLVPSGASAQSSISGFRISSRLHASPLPLTTDGSSITSKNYIGLEIGLTGSLLSGSDNFEWPYDYPFNDGFAPTVPTLLPMKTLGSGLGFLVGGVVDLRLSDMFGLIGKLNFHTNHTERTETEQFYCKAPPDPFTGVIDSALTSQTKSYSSTLSYFTGDLLLRYNFNRMDSMVWPALVVLYFSEIRWRSAGL